ncbi:MAG: ABC transporter substrate-binding protein [Rhodospirillales bacterium]|nr:ABC transporter substrate-binding protein [Rhodospirillales bacterium]
MRRSSRIVFVCAFVLAALSLAPPAARGDNGTPRAVVEEFHAHLLAVMKEGPALGHAGRVRRLQPEVERTFHLPVMIQVATGTFWRQASPAQQAALIAAFTRVSTATYAKNFKKYAGEKFETMDERPGPQNTTLLDTRIVESDGETTEITYVMKKGADAWKVVDVIVDKGISELALRRSEFSRQLREAGIDSLVAALNRKADELAAAAP